MTFFCKLSLLLIIMLYFRLILIAEKKTVYLKFPTPLINRMEKHFVLISSVLEDWQEAVLQQFEMWISQYSLPKLVEIKEKIC